MSDHFPPVGITVYKRVSVARQAATVVNSHAEYVTLETPNGTIRRIERRDFNRDWTDVDSY